MKNLERAIALLGSQGKLASAVGVSRPLINYWLRVGVSLKYIDKIERATGGKVKAADLWNEKREAA